jgi:hypothetical protein
MFTEPGALGVLRPPGPVAGTGEHRIGQQAVVLGKANERGPQHPPDRHLGEQRLPPCGQVVCGAAGRVGALPLLFNGRRHVGDVAGARAQVVLHLGDLAGQLDGELVAVDHRCPPTAWALRSQSSGMRAHSLRVRTGTASPSSMGTSVVPGAATSSQRASSAVDGSWTA